MPQSPLGLRYGCDRSRLPGELSRHFVELSPEGPARDWLGHAESSRPGRLKTALHRFLRRWMSDFDANGVLGMYPMHLATTAQWRDLLGDTPRGRLLDVGAGSGDVTSELAPLFREVGATELSRAMARRLRARGYRVWTTDVAEQGAPDPPYEVVSCLNVLDRCLLPLSLVRNCRDALASKGRLVLGVPLPYSPHVYLGPRAVEPLEDLDIDAPDWETSATLLYRRVLEPLGLCVERWTRLPYLSGGDARQTAYELDTAVWVCRRAGSTDSSAPSPLS